jgi:hypothetical protein
LASLESYIQQAGAGSQFAVNVQQVAGQNSGDSQFLVTLSAPTTTSSTDSSSSSSASSASITTAAAAAPSSSPTGEVEGNGQELTGVLPFPNVPAVLQDYISSWDSYTPQQVGFQLANYPAGMSGAPTDTVPGTNYTFGDLTQTQATAYGYGTTWGTGGQSMQDFLDSNVGPSAPWNLTYNEIQANPAIQSYAVTKGMGDLGIPTETVPADAAPGAYNADNLPNPALIQYLPADQQASAWAAVSMEGSYGENASAAAQAYAMMKT